VRDKYSLICLAGGEVVPDHYTSVCPHRHSSLLRTQYREEQIQFQPLPGIFRFMDWLPIDGMLPIDAGPICYKSEGLAKELRLPALYVGFTGYWPERGCYASSGSFKELEAIPTVIRLAEKRGPGIIVVASAGNTARAFLQVSAVTGTPVVVVVPSSALGRLWTTLPAGKAYVIGVDGDYTDAIRFSREVAAHEPFVPEGGAGNVARRDGMGTVLLASAEKIKQIPSYYFQAVGSGTGAISAWEASLRLISDGRFGTALPQLHLSQNIPFVPMVAAWEAGRRDIIPEIDMPDAEESVRGVYSDVLTNREPPYGICGGLYDALSDCRGSMHAITNQEAHEAERLFMECEGIDIDPAAAVCTASLIRASEEEKILRDRSVLLNITGGGYKLISESLPQVPVHADCSVPAGERFDLVASELSRWVRGLA
jgi:cysteate synthase